MTTPDDPRIGTELAGFRIEAVIGRGGMSVVYRAVQVRYGRTVALKVLSPELAAAPGFRDRFEQEWRAAALLEHPNIVPIYEAGEADGVLYIAMRYVKGIDLTALLGRQGRLDLGQALGIVGQVGVALDAAHEQGLVHRDVKPANILPASGSGLEDDHVYLTDFGVAKQTSAPTGLTKTGLFIGTVGYAAPEQIEGKPIDGRADVYALGCVLFQCLTGALPYEKDSEVAMLYAHLMEPPPSFHALRPDLPAELDRVIAKALAKPRDDRYRTCRALVEDVRAVPGLAPVTAAAAVPTVVAESAVAEERTLVNRPAAATTAAGPRRARPWWRTRAAIALAALVLVAGAGAGVGIALAGGGGGGEPTPPDPKAGAGGPNGGAIVFSSERDGDADIYGMRLDGTGRVHLTNDPGTEAGPRWSPDGSEIVYYGDADGDFEIYRMNADGSGVTQLTDNEVEDRDPSWSPDGASIVYTETWGGEPEVFQSRQRAPASLRQLTENDGYRKSSRSRAASASLHGIKWPYRSKVIITDAWPMYVLSAFALMPAASSRSRTCAGAPADARRAAEGDSLHGARPPDLPARPGARLRDPAPCRRQAPVDCLFQALAGRRRRAYGHKVPVSRQVARSSAVASLRAAPRWPRVPGLPLLKGGEATSDESR